MVLELGYRIGRPRWHDEVKEDIREENL